MKYTALIALFITVAALGWKVTEQMDPTALAMGLGVLFGVMATIPGMLMVIASNRCREYHEPERRRQSPGQPQKPAPPQLQNWRVVGPNKIGERK